ncbi:hypothetical protein Acsp05_34680 [Actinokineospora sp. NBRC 105648]|nr:hypothetical protein Acsp05_34680 [Actinokineospora sp. NBRC 105648]
MVAFAEQTLQSLLPRTWQLTAYREERPTTRGRADARFTITAADGTSAWVLVEVKSIVAPRDVAGMAARLAALQEAETAAAIVVAPFISPTARRQLADHGLGWLDVTGNLRLRLDSPAVYLDRAGADRSSFRDPADRLLKSLRGPAAAKVVLALSETPLPTGVRELAFRADVSAATSARVLELLDRDAVIDRSADGVVTSVRKRALLTRWTADYQVMKANEVITTVDPRGISHALEASASLGVRYAVTGSAAARAYLPEGVTPVSPLVSLSLYTEDPIQVMDHLRLKKAEHGANVLVMSPYDEVVHARARLVDGLTYAAPAQVVADLLTGAGRSSEEAEQLMSALGETDPGWE